MRKLAHFRIGFATDSFVVLVKSMRQGGCDRAAVASQLHNLGPNPPSRCGVTDYNRSRKNRPRSASDAFNPVAGQLLPVGRRRLDPIAQIDADLSNSPSRASASPVLIAHAFMIMLRK
jgi:hypothetical protein